MKSFCFNKDYKIICLPTQCDISFLIRDEIYEDFSQKIDEIFVIAKMLNYEIRVFEGHTYFDFFFLQHSDAYSRKEIIFIFDKKQLLTNIYIDNQEKQKNIIDSLKHFMLQL